MTRLALAALLVLVGCGSASFDNPLHVSGSRTIAATEDGGRIHVVNVEEGTITSAHTWGSDEARVSSPLDVGLEPTRIARHGTRYFATLRGEGALAVLEDGPDGLVLDHKIPIGSEPYGVVVTEDGRLFVSLSRENEVVGLDAETLDVIGRWTVPDEPRGLAVSGGDSVFVGCLKNGAVYEIDLRRDTVSAVELPTATRTLRGGEVVELTTRVTGDPSVSPDGRFLAVPVLLVDNETSGDGSSESSDTTYGAGGSGPDRVNAGVALVGLDSSGSAARPISVLNAAVETEVLVGFEDGGIVEEFAEFGVARSFPSAAIFSPDSRQILVPMEGSATVAVLELDKGPELMGLLFEDMFEENGFAMPRATAVTTPAGPRSAVFVGSREAVIHSWLDRSISSLEDSQNLDFEGNRSLRQAAVEASMFTASVERGRVHFNGANNPIMQASGSGISCATCHTDGREDGLTWPLEDGPRQTMNLGGVVSETLPITWTGAVQQVSTEVILTSGNRMGGLGADPGLAADVAAYIDTTRAALPSWQPDAAAIARGEAIFNRSEVGCADCHPAPSFTDGENHRIAGREVNTPTLRGIAASGPYFHDGQALDLDAVMSTAVIGVMGDASMLSDDEIADLKAYLLTL